MLNDKHNIDALIFLGVTRAKIQLKKANVDYRFYFDYGNKYDCIDKLGIENPYVNKLKALPRTKEIHGVSIFKQDYIRELIYLIADDNFWNQYRRAFSYKRKQQVIEKANIYRVTYTPNIIYSGGSFAERSILLRLLYALCGFNPYSFDPDARGVIRTINFEVSKIKLAIQRVHDFVSFVGYPKFRHPSFPFALNVALRLLEKSEKSLAGLSELWLHQTVQDRHLPLNRGLELSDLIQKDVLLEIWGGTLKSFKREQKENFKEGKSVMKMYRAENLQYRESPPPAYFSDKIDYVMFIDAIEFLKSKGIDTRLKNRRRLADFSYKYIYYLSKKTREDSTDFTMKAAINALEESDIYDESMRYILV